MKNFSSYHAHKVKLLMLNEKNRNKQAILIFFWPLSDLSKNWSLSNMHNKFEEDPSNFF